MGAYNSGCSKLLAPVLNQDPKGPMLEVSHASTNTGLTKAADPGEPELYAPSGKKSFARVTTTDDVQGTAAADFASETLKVKKCYILNDNQTYGQGIAKAFEARAKEVGIEVVANEPTTRRPRTTPPSSRRSRPPTRTASTSVASTTSTAASC